MQKIIGVCLTVLLAVIPIAPVVCDALCDAVPETMTPSGCHDLAPIDQTVVSTNPCAPELIAAPESILDRPFRLQQRSVAAILPLNSPPERASVISHATRQRLDLMMRPPITAILRI